MLGGAELEGSDEMDAGRLSWLIALAIRIRFPKAGISSSLSRLTSSSNSTSPVISCSEKEYQVR